MNVRLRMISARLPGKRPDASHTPYGAPKRSAVQELKNVIVSVTFMILVRSASPEKSSSSARVNALPIGP